MKVLVTGGSGFIGTRLVSELIEAGHEATIFDKAPSHRHPSLVVRGDVRNPEQLTEAVRGKDAVFHLAAEHRDDVTPVSLYEEVNVGGAANLTKAMNQTGCRRLIFTSTVAVYPLNASNPTEDREPRPFNRYGESKLGAEKVFREWIANRPDASLTILRPCVVFGERNRGNVYNLLHQISRGRFVMVGNGRNRKSMAYVGNIAPFLISRLAAGPGAYLFNYADKPDLTTNELIEAAHRSLGNGSVLAQFRIPYPIGLLGGYVFDVMAKVTGKKYPVSSIRIRKFCADTTVSTDRIEKAGFRRPYTLAEGIARMIRSEFLSGDQSAPLFESAGG